jgi:hypothetical protein
MNVIEILARVAFAFSLLTLFIAFMTIAVAVAWKLFRHLRPSHEEPPRPVPATDVWYYRQRHRRCIQLLLDRVAQLSRDLKVAQQEIARLNGYRASPAGE